MFHSHSVLVGPVGPDHAPTVGVLGSLIGFVLGSSPIVFYTIALFVTARMVWARIDFRTLGGRPHTGRAIISLSIRALLAVLGLGIANALLLWAVMNARWPALVPWWVVSVVISAVTMSMFAYVIIPPALRLLAGPMESPGKRSIRSARRYAVAAIVASAGVMILEHIAVRIIYVNHAEILAVEAVASLIAALPYVALYIALSLLAMNEQTELLQEHTVLVPRET